MLRYCQKGSPEAPFAKLENARATLYNTLRQQNYFPCTIYRSRRTTRCLCCSDNIVDILTVRAIGKNRCMHGTLTKVVGIFRGGEYRTSVRTTGVQCCRGRPSSYDHSTAVVSVERSFSILRKFIRCCTSIYECWATQRFCPVYITLIRRRRYERQRRRWWVKSLNIVQNTVQRSNDVTYNVV